jgi:hypothetical protein
VSSFDGGRHWRLLVAPAAASSAGPTSSSSPTKPHSSSDPPTTCQNTSTAPTTAAAPGESFASGNHHEEAGQRPHHNRSPTASGDIRERWRRRLMSRWRYFADASRGVASSRGASMRGRRRLMFKSFFTTFGEAAGPNGWAASGLAVTAPSRGRSSPGINLRQATCLSSAKPDRVIFLNSMSFSAGGGVR